MNTEDQIKQYLDSLAQPKREDLLALHQLAISCSKGAEIWFLDGKNSEKKVVSNPNIGYGSCLIQYANGSQKEFYKIGLSANTTGISIYVFDLNSSLYLIQTYGERIGKAKITGYCIQFKSLKDLDMEVLESLFRNELKVASTLS